MQPTCSFAVGDRGRNATVIRGSGTIGYSGVVLVGDGVDCPARAPAVVGAIREVWLVFAET